MSGNDTVRVGVLGAGAWARFAHLPGYKRDPRCEVCLLYTSDAAAERSSVDLGGRRIIKTKNYGYQGELTHYS